MKVAGWRGKDNLISNRYRGNPAGGIDGGRSGRGNVSPSPDRPFLHHLFVVQSLNGQAEPGSRRVIPRQIQRGRDPPRFPRSWYRPRSAGFQLPPPRCTPRHLPGSVRIRPPSRFRDLGAWSRSSCSPSRRPRLTRASSAGMGNTSEYQQKSCQYHSGSERSCLHLFFLLLETRLLLAGLLTWGLDEDSRWGIPPGRFSPRARAAPSVESSPDMPRGAGNVSVSDQPLCRKEDLPWKTTRRLSCKMV